MREVCLSVVGVLLLLTIAGAQSKPAPDNPEKSPGNSQRFLLAPAGQAGRALQERRRILRAHGSRSRQSRPVYRFHRWQLNNVLKSLTVVDLGEGRISGVRYNSIAPLGERLKALRLPFGQLDSQEDRLNTLTREIADLQQKYVQVQVQLDRMVQDITLDQQL
jgi:hypothetical protein